MAFGSQPSSNIAFSEESHFAPWHFRFPGQPACSNWLVRGVEAWPLTSAQAVPARAVSVGLPL